MSQPQTITLERLRSLTSTSGQIRKAARAALPRAESLAASGKLASILLDRELRHIQVYSA